MHEGNDDGDIININAMIYSMNRLMRSGAVAKSAPLK
jgi:hypothetical protein